MSDKPESKIPNIKPDKRYRRRSDGHVFTGQQLLDFLTLLQAALLLDIIETNDPATQPDSKYGLESLESE